MSLTTGDLPRFPDVDAPLAATLARGLGLGRAALNGERQIWFVIDVIDDSLFLTAVILAGIPGLRALLDGLLIFMGHLGHRNCLLGCLTVLAREQHHAPGLRFVDISL